MANFIGLKLARDYASKDPPHDGIRDRWAVYPSEERHVSVDKAVDAVVMTDPKRVAGDHDIFICGNEEGCKKGSDSAIT